jgi:hypothetical protein
MDGVLVLLSGITLLVKTEFVSGAAAAVPIFHKVVRKHGQTINERSPYLRPKLATNFYGLAVTAHKRLRLLAPRHHMPLSQW